MKKHTPGASIAQAPERVPLFTVDVVEWSEGASATVLIDESDDERTTRTVPGSTCREVVEAVAFIIALVLDPEASANIQDEQEVPRAALAVTSPDGSDENAPRQTVSKPSPKVDDHSTSRAVMPRGRKNQAPYVLGAMAQATATGGMAPGVSLGIGGAMNVRSRASGLLSPLVELAAVWTRSPVVSTRVGDARFELRAARSTICPLLFERLSPLLLRPCTFFDVGVLDGEGVGVDRPRSASVLWMAAGAQARAEAHWGPWVTELAAGAIVPFAGDRFYLEPENTTVHRISPGFLAAFGFGLEFP